MRITLAGADDLAEEISRYAQEVAKTDATSHFLSLAVQQGPSTLRKLLGWLVVGDLSFFVLPILSTIGDFLLALGVPMILFIANKVLPGYLEAISRSRHVADPAQEVLAETLDLREARFFELTGGTPPQRARLN